MQQRAVRRDFLLGAWDTVFPLRHPKGEGEEWEGLVQSIHFPSNSQGMVTFELSLKARLSEKPESEPETLSTSYCLCLPGLAGA